MSFTISSSAALMTRALSGLFFSTSRNFASMWFATADTGISVKSSDQEGQAGAESFKFVGDRDDRE